MNTSPHLGVDCKPTPQPTPNNKPALFIHPLLDSPETSPMVHDDALPMSPSLLYSPTAKLPETCQTTFTNGTFAPQSFLSLLEESTGDKFTLISQELAISNSRINPNELPFHIALQYGLPTYLSSLIEKATNHSFLYKLNNVNNNNPQKPSLQQCQPEDYLSDERLLYIMVHASNNPKLLSPTHHTPQVTISVRDIVNFCCNFLPFHHKLTQLIHPGLFKSNHDTSKRHDDGSKGMINMFAILGFSHENRIFNILKYRMYQHLTTLNLIDHVAENNHIYYLLPTSQSKSGDSHESDIKLVDIHGSHLSTVLSPESTDEILKFFSNDDKTTLQAQSNELQINKGSTAYFEHNLCKTLSALLNGDYIVAQAPIIANLSDVNVYMTNIKPLSSNQKYSQHIEEGGFVRDLFGLGLYNSTNDEESSAATKHMGKLCEKLSIPAQILQKLPNVPYMKTEQSQTTIVSQQTTELIIRGVVDFLVRNDIKPAQTDKSTQSFFCDKLEKKNCDEQLYYTYDLWDTKLHANPEPKDTLQVLCYAYVLNYLLEKHYTTSKQQCQRNVLITHVAIVTNSGYILRVPIHTPITPTQTYTDKMSTFYTQLSSTVCSALLCMFKQLQIFIETKYHPLLLPIQCLRENVTETDISMVKQFKNKTLSVLYSSISKYIGNPSQLYSLNHFHKKDLLASAESGDHYFKDTIMNYLPSSHQKAKTSAFPDYYFLKTIQPYSLYYLAYNIIMHQLYQYCSSQAAMLSDAALSTSNMNENFLNDNIFIPTLNGFGTESLLLEQDPTNSRSTLIIDGYCTTTYLQWFVMLVTLTHHINTACDEDPDILNLIKQQGKKTNPWLSFANSQHYNTTTLSSHFEGHYNWLPVSPVALLISQLTSTFGKTLSDQRGIPISSPFSITTPQGCEAILKSLDVFEKGNASGYTAILPKSMTTLSRQTEIILQFFSQWSQLLTAYLITQVGISHHDRVAPKIMGNLQIVQELLNLRVYDQAFTFIRETTKSGNNGNQKPLQWLEEQLGHYLSIYHTPSANSPTSQVSASPIITTKNTLNCDIFLDLEGANMINDVNVLQPYTLTNTDLIRIITIQQEELKNQLSANTPHFNTIDRQLRKIPALYRYNSPKLQDDEADLVPDAIKPPAFKTLGSRNYISKEFDSETEDSSPSEDKGNECLNTLPPPIIELSAPPPVNGRENLTGLFSAFEGFTIDDNCKDISKNKNDRVLKHLMSGYPYFAKNSFFMGLNNEIEYDRHNIINPKNNNLYYLFGFTYTCTVGQYVKINTMLTKQQEKYHASRSQTKLINSRQQWSFTQETQMIHTQKVISMDNTIVKNVKQSQKIQLLRNNVLNKDDYNNKLSQLYTHLQQSIPQFAEDSDVILSEHIWDGLSTFNPIDSTTPLNNPDDIVITVFVDLWAHTHTEEFYCLYIFLQFCQVMQQVQQLTNLTNDSSNGFASFNVYHYHIYERTALHNIYLDLVDFIQNGTDSVAIAKVQEIIDVDEIYRLLMKFCPLPREKDLRQFGVPETATSNKISAKSKTNMSFVGVNNQYGHCVDVLDLVKKLLRTTKGSLSLKKVEQLILVVMKNQYEYFSALHEMKLFKISLENANININDSQSTSLFQDNCDGRKTAIKEGGSSVVSYMIWRHGVFNKNVEDHVKKPLLQQSATTYFSFDWSKDGNDTILYDLRQYNRDDCYHTLIFVQWMFDIYKQLARKSH